MNNTTIFLIRHAEKSRNTIYLSDKTEREKDLFRPLSVKGMRQAQKIAALDSLKNISAIYSSEFSRTIFTAIPLSEAVNRDIQITNAFNERLRRKNSCYEMPENFRIHQMLDFDYKIPGGESRREVFERFHSGITQILNTYPGKQIAVFSHKTAITMFLMQYCEYQINQDVYMTYNGSTVFSGKWDGSPEIFQITFREKQLITVSKIQNGCTSD